MSTVQTIPAGWLVAYGNAGMRFDTRSEARRYARDYQKQVAQRGGKFKPSISRLPARVIDTAKGATL